MKIDNRAFIRRLSFKTMKAARARNIIAVCAIALTAMLFTSLFTVILSINTAFQQANFRQAGGWSHGTFKYMTREQFEEFRTDPLIKRYGLRRFAGMPKGEPFLKSRVEVGYSDANQAHWMYCDPKEGRLPAEGTDEAATDTRVLELLGVEPEVGNEFSLTFDVDGTEVTERFVLSGWWEYDEAIVANHVLLPHSRVQAIYEGTGIGEGIGKDGMTGSWNMDVMFGSSLHIERDMNKILSGHGYQAESRSAGGDYIATGVNWGYTGSRLAVSADPSFVIAISGLLLIIILTGYLIIYNVFNISVAADTRFYGLLKTVGTTGKQIGRIIRRQAMALSLAGIPLGLIAGYFTGALLTPGILSRLNGVREGSLSASPVIFAGSAAFALLTVLISCRRPGKMAAKVSPVEAVRHTEASRGSRFARRSRKGASLPDMALANLGRSRGKTAVTVASLSLAALLLHVTVTFTNGFDMDKYMSDAVADFVVADAGYFQVDRLWSEDMALSEEAVGALESIPGIQAGGRVYGGAGAVEEFVSEDYYRAAYGAWNDAESLELQVASAERNDMGMLADRVQLYGMESYALDKLTVLEGDLSKLSEPGGRYIAAVYSDDDYGNPLMDSNWAKLGDTVTLRYVEEYEHLDPYTGEIVDPQNMTEGRHFLLRAKRYRDIAYETAALVVVPHSLSYRYYGADEFILNDLTFLRDNGTGYVMYYAFDADDDAEADAERYLSDLSSKLMPHLDYESKAKRVAEFESFRSMFLMLGGVMSFVVGLVGVLNFLNALLSGIIARRREFAVLQAVGMTGRQLKAMLICEGLYYALGAALVSLALSFAAGVMLREAAEGTLWFFTYRFTALPILFTTLVFSALGAVLPPVLYRAAARRSVCERLRETE